MYGVCMAMIARDIGMSNIHFIAHPAAALSSRDSSKRLKVVHSTIQQQKV